MCEDDDKVDSYPKARKVIIEEMLALAELVGANEHDYTHQPNLRYMRDSITATADNLMNIAHKIDDNL